MEFNSSTQHKKHFEHTIKKEQENFDAIHRIPEIA